MDKIYQNPLHLKEEKSIEYLRAIFKFHFNNTPYWKKLNPIDMDDIFQGNLKKTFENIFNSGIAVKEEYLRNNWLKFVPTGYRGKIRFYQSSGTTRERAIIHWDREYSNILLKYLRQAFNEIYGLDEIYNDDHQMRALAHGPYGWYQDEVSELVWSYGGILYFIGMETDGLKKVYREQGLDAALKLLQPLIKYTARVMEKDRINTVRSASPLMTLFEQYSDRIETAIISGVGVSHNFFADLHKKFPSTTLIPLYGYYAFGDIVGIERKDSIVYYPNYPFTIMFPLKLVDGQYRIVKYNKRGQLGLIIARPELLIIKVEDETVIRVPPNRPFGWDGFGDPERDMR